MSTNGSNDEPFPNKMSKTNNNEEERSDSLISLFYFMLIYFNSFKI